MAVQVSLDKVPRALWIAFAVDVLRDMASFVTTTNDLDDRTWLVRAVDVFDRGLGTATLVLALIGVLELSRRCRGGAVLWLAASAYIAWLAVELLNVTWMTMDYDVARPLWDRIHYVMMGVSLAFIIGWALAARSVVVAIAVAVPMAVNTFRDQIFQSWFHEHDFAALMRVHYVTDLALTLAIAFAAVMTVSRGDVAPRASAGRAHGLSLMAGGLWTACAAAGVALLGGIAMSDAHSSRGPLALALLALGIAMTGACLFGVGATSALRDPDRGPGSWWLHAAAALVLGATSVVAFQIFPDLVLMTMDHDTPGRGEEGAFAIAAALVLTSVGVLAGLIGLATAMAGRVSAGVGSITGALIAYCVLIAIATGLVVASSHGSGARILVVALCGVVALAVAGIAFSAAGRELGAPITVPVRRPDRQP